MHTSLPHGPRIPASVQTGLIFASQGHILHWWQRRYGDRFTVRIQGFGTVVYLTKPEDIKEVFRGAASVFHAGEANSILRGLLGPNSVLVTDEDAHKHSRALMTPAFHGDSVRKQIETMVSITEAEVARWPVDREFRLHPRMQAIALEVILRTVLGVDDPYRRARLRQVLPRLIDIGSAFELLPPPKFLANIGRWRRREELARLSDSLLYQQIRAHRNDPNLAERDDVLAMMMRSADERGNAMSDEELRDQLMTLLLAGHETTATALAWTMERLIRNPGVLKEAERAAYEDDTEYLDALGKESLRSRPVVFEIGRVLVEPAEVGGYRLPAGTLVAPSIEMVHHSHQHYPQPAAFRPERFLGTKPDSATWFPFGGGIRRCLGATFATVEMRTVLREILRRVEFTTTIARGERAKPRHVTLVPARGTRVRVQQHRILS